MSKILVLLFLFLVIFLAPKTYAQALNDCPNPIAKTIPNGGTEPGPIFSNSKGARFIINVTNNADYGGKWKMEFECGIRPSNEDAEKLPNSNSDIFRDKDNTGCEFSKGNHTIKVIAVTDKGQEIPQCIAHYSVVDSDTLCKLFLKNNKGDILTPEDKVITSQTDLTVYGENLTEGGRFGIYMDDQLIKGRDRFDYLGIEKDSAGKTFFSYIYPPDRRPLLTPTAHVISLHGDDGFSNQFGPPLCSVTFTAGTPSNPGSVINNPANGSPAPIQPVVSGGHEAKGCTDDPKNPAISTAIGCIHTNPAELVKDVMTFVIGISGGLAFLMMLLGAFQMLTSAGNPETLNAGKGRITNAVIGLLIIIFAILLLQIIGVDILKIPGFDRK